MTARRRPSIWTNGRRLYLSIPIFGKLRLGRSFTIGQKR